ncbi:squalene--hopene cyclase [Maridesulfovibrio ferrireducens]|uniref:squalene--hopene cyclase n=1 Tax=Maridesulfovibrio ferrireducens TaxID=246191 RepID=UPI001A24AC3D|nr:squalene--hopene cyclase [Maridesulfovibrio ferrireducens]MBI9112843.1 squalene--hopene cyclase [Maridesulfovibrio ferrireducens]
MNKNRKSPKNNVSKKSNRSRNQVVALLQPKEALKRVVSRFRSLQSPDGYWVFALEADVTIPSEYIMFQRFLNRKMDPKVAERLGNYIRSKQMPDGGWPLHDHDGPVNISASVKAYMALKVLGDDKEAEHMVRARQIILAKGGAETANVFTRICLATFGQLPWHCPPAMPIEIVLLPKWFFFHLTKVSYWSRSVIYPLLIIYAKKPVCNLRPEESVPELFCKPQEELIYIDRYRDKGMRKNLFILLDRIMKRTIHLIPDSIHNKALKYAENWTREHMAGRGGIGAIFPAMANAVTAMSLLGYDESDPDYARGLQAVDDLMVDRFNVSEESPWEFTVVTGGRELSAAPELDISPNKGTAENLEQCMCQPCNSPIWDTCLTLSAIVEAGENIDSKLVQSTIKWLFDQQIFFKGDWISKAPSLEGGGWAFQFENTFYPDLDDTAMVLMAMARAGVLKMEEHRENFIKSVNWLIGMQCTGGGYAAFDIDNDALYLNDIPFADHGALLDPPTSDLTARVLELLGVIGYNKSFRPIKEGIEFLKKEQEDDGSWFGRWGVNYIYGTWSVLCGLRQVGEDMNSSYVCKAVEWFENHQNKDGGWGETCLSYNDPRYAGMGESTPSQTSWALLGLMAAHKVNSKAVSKGIRYLLDTQKDDGSWDEKYFTGTGFPKVFYLRYHGYSQYFPMWALGVYERFSAGEDSQQILMRLSSPLDLGKKW